MKTSLKRDIFLHEELNKKTLDYRRQLTPEKKSVLFTGPNMSETTITELQIFKAV